MISRRRVSARASQLRRWTGFVAAAVLLTLSGACSKSDATSSEQLGDGTSLAAHRLPRPAGPVLDAAEIIAPSHEQSLDDRLRSFNAQTGHALVVVTTPDLAGEDIATYALELFNRWGVGGQNRNDGVVLLVAMEERQVRIATGFGMEARLPDQRCSQIIKDAILPQFRKGDMAAGISAGVDALTFAMTAT